MEEGKVGVRVEEKEKYLDYDKLLENIGEFGLFQKIACALLWLPAAVGGIHVLMYSFTGLDPPNYHCSIPNCDSTNYDGFIPEDKDHPSKSCSYYQAMPTSNTNNTCHRVSDEKITCKSGYVFEGFEFDETTVTRFELVCGNTDFIRSVAFTGSAYMLGLMFGSFLLGYISDKFGRKKSLLVSIVGSTVCSFAGAFMPEYWSYLVLRFFVAMASVGLFNEAFTLTIELMGSKEIVPWLPWVTYKNLLGNCIQMPYAVGEAILGVFAYFLRDYETLQWVMSVVMLVQLPAWYFLPESPRWLLNHGRTEEARNVMMKAAKMNGKPVDLSHHQIKKPEKTVENAVEEKQLGVSDLFSREIWVITVAMSFIWPIVTLAYFGLGLSMTQLGGDIFVSFILGAITEIPGYALSFLLIDIWGRKPFFFWCLLGTGAGCIGAGFLEEGGVRTGLALLGKMCASGSFSVIYMFTAEIYPTSIRQTAIGTMSMTARIGGITAPYIALYLPHIQKQLPMLLMGGSAAIGALLTLLLPETLGSVLPEKIEDVEKMKANGKSFWKCVSPKATFTEAHSLHGEFE